MAKRRYGQYCALARALDAVGERWTLLVVRELLLGPRRYTDLLDSLPGIGTNLLADRLKELEQQGVVQRTKLPPPAPAAVYELTEYGRELEPAVVALTRWGSRELRKPRRGEHFRPAWLGLAMLAAFQPDAATGVTEKYEFRIGEEVLHACVGDGELEVRQGPSDDPDLTFICDERTLRKILSGRMTLTGAVAHDEARIAGARAALVRCAEVFGLTERSHEPSAAAS
jgi:DNA-binding HxlR family transcriptional regulator/putative sterol carrier protein